MSNIRAENYGLPKMDWITTKIKAGKIVPALATTTAAIAGLQTIEMIKILNSLPINQIRNGFMNLAVPCLLMSEPVAPHLFELCDGLKVNLWDRWDIK